MVSVGFDSRMGQYTLNRVHELVGVIRRPEVDIQRVETLEIVALIPRIICRQPPVIWIGIRRRREVL